MSEPDPTEQPSPEDEQIVDDAEGAEGSGDASVPEPADSASESDIAEQEQGQDSEPEDEPKPEADATAEIEPAAEYGPEPAAQPTAEIEPAPAAEVPAGESAEQVTQVVPVAQPPAATQPGLGFAPLDDAPTQAVAVAAGPFDAAGASATAEFAQVSAAPAFQSTGTQGPYNAYGVPGYGLPADGAVEAPPVDPAAKKRKRKRILWTTAVVVVGALIGGGVYALLPGRTGNSVVTAVDCNPGTTLASCLIKAPAGAVELPGTSSDDIWPKQTSGGLDQFAEHIITDSPGLGGDASNELTAAGAKTIVHNDWNAVDGSNVDLVVLSFSTQQGAASWNALRAAEILAAYPGQTVAVPGDTAGAAHAAVKKDAQGDIDAAYSVVVGNLVLDVAFSSPSPFNAKDLANWAGTELASLHTAPPAPADPAPVAPGTQQVACQFSIYACLMPEPDGGQAWSYSNDPHWISGPSLSVSQYVHLFWDGQPSSEQSGVLSDFTSDGVTGIGHESWLMEGGDLQADIYVVRTITSTGASTLAQDHLGEPQWPKGVSGISHSVPGMSDIDAWYASKVNSYGMIGYYFTATVGDAVVAGWAYFYGSFDSSYANSWSKAEVDAVTATERTEPLGLFSLNAPPLPALTQGTCGSSGDCLLPLPNRASDTTSSSYQNSQALTAGEFVSNYDTGVANELDTWFGTDGFQSGEHRSFTASDGATADAVLLKFATSAQAKAAALLQFGLNSPSDRVCTDAAVPDTLCLAAPVSTTDPLLKETVWVLAWKGDYAVAVQVTISNSADLGDAYTWAQQQLDMLPAN